MENLRRFVKQHSSTLLKLWYEAAIAAYPPETAQLLRSKRDRFANPLGHTVKTSLSEVLEALGQGGDIEKLSNALYPLIRVKSVQDFKPSEAVSSVLELKRVVRRVLSEQPDTQGSEDIIKELEPFIDELLCSCFDHYMECRQKLSEIKEEELKRNLYMLLRKANMVDSPGQGDG